MINTLLGIKKGMTSSYDARGRRVGATIIEVSPNFVTQVKSTDGKDGYSAAQLGAGSKKNLAKPQMGHLKKAQIEAPLQYLREVKTKEDIKPGQEIKLGQVFSKGDSVKVTGVSKGRGFQGGVKRYGFHGGPKTHGQSDRHRAPGSVGSGTTPGRVYKGKHMAGHLGSDQVSYLGLEVIAVDRLNNLLTIKGGVPGPVGGLIIVTKQGRIKGYTPPPEEKEDEEEDAKVSENREVAEDQAMAQAATPQTAEPANQSVDQPISEPAGQPEVVEGENQNG